MEVIIYLLSALGGILYIILRSYAYSGRADRKLAEMKHKKQLNLQLKKQITYEELKKKSNFRKINSVKGILNVNGKDIHTYDTGDLIIDNTIGLRFSAVGYVLITDIFYRSDNKSIIDSPTKNLNDQEIKDYIFDTLNQYEREGKVRRKTIGRIETTFEEVSELNKLLRKGIIDRDFEDDTYICRY